MGEKIPIFLSSPRLFNCDSFASFIVSKKYPESGFSRVWEGFFLLVQKYK